jgi:hypothetical protein
LASPVLGLLRGIVSVAAGLLAAAVFFQVSAAVILLTTVGIPLGAESRNSTFGELLGYLAVGVAAAFVGGWATGRVAGSQMRWPILLLAVILGATVYVGFTQPASHWPYWWAVTLAALAPPGAWVGGRGIGLAPFSRSR